VSFKATSTLTADAAGPTAGSTRGPDAGLPKPTDGSTRGPDSGYGGVNRD